MNMTGFCTRDRSKLFTVFCILFGTWKYILYIGIEIWFIKNMVESVELEYMKSSHTSPSSFNSSTFSRVFVNDCCWNVERKLPEWNNIRIEEPNNKPGSFWYRLMYIFLSLQSFPLLLKTILSKTKGKRKCYQSNNEFEISPSW